MKEEGRTDYNFWATTSTFQFKPVCPVKANAGRGTHYIFTRPGYRPASFHIRRRSKCARASYEPSCADLKIFILGVWYDLICWIRKESESISLFGKYCVKKLDWNYAYGRCFRFMDLPPELRNMVYDLVIGPHISPRPARITNGQFKDGLERRPLHMVVTHPYWKALSLFPEFPCGSISTQQNGPQPNSMLLVSKKVSAEFEHRTWSIPTKVFFNPVTMFRLAPCILRTKIPGALRRITLDFSNLTYHQFLGFEVDHASGFVSRETLDGDLLRLGEIHTLEHLHLRFRTSAPASFYNVRYRPLSDHAPVTSRYGHISRDPWAHMRRPVSSKVSCQKIFVDWFFTMAYRELRWIPKITFGGHVKESTRAKWFAIFDDMAPRKNYDFTDEIAIIKATPSSKL